MAFNALHCVTKLVYDTRFHIESVWLAIEERVFSVELLLCMKGYCWRDKNCCYRENKNATRARKITTWKSTNLQKMNVCQILNRNESQWHSNLRENALTLTLKGFPMCAHWCGSQKKETFTGFRPGDFSYAIFRVKFNVEFTRQAVNFSI